jgi:hypothetical protein
MSFFYCELRERETDELERFREDEVPEDDIL